ncbi:MAG: hypothetical protein K6T76_13000 [Alicyclobacillus mali]|uniref:hypothetical protein n=1 Tax=Alicyclobacillus mali (ex Roth et al. 2021) TaxID=1123961 RepID=UPI0023F2CDF8|nr:hypothetical protein [Alicyclobacillus mali (ex Roth et al. 2021)]MCL6489835.1 hypothetical protein [Alicyclobacillus mali (ex Roth et al. 2021)]
MRKSMTLAVILMANMLTTTGCGILGGKPATLRNTVTPERSTPTSVHVLSLQQRTKLALQPTLYERVQVVTADGKPVTLNVQVQPLIFFSPALGGQQLFQALSQAKPAHSPVLIATGFMPNETKAQDVADTETLLKQYHITWPVYYVFGNPFGSLISGVPDTYVWRNGHVWHIPGTLSSPSEWNQALS